jgi:genome maintenance exonuclease 1
MVFLREDKFEKYDIEAITTEEGRRYRVPNGPSEVLYESVTTALGDLPGKKEGLMEWRQKVGEEEANRISRQAANRGTKVHWMLENYLNGTDEYELSYGQMPDAVQMFAQIKPILDAGIQKVYMQECALFSHEYRLAGRVDLICQINNELTVVDFKTSRKPKKEEWIEDYFLQCAAYSFMVEEMYGEKVSTNLIMIAVEGNIGAQIFPSYPYKYKEHDFFTGRIQK